MSSPASVLTPYKPGLFTNKGVIVTGGGTGLGYAIGKPLTHAFLSIPDRDKVELSMQCWQDPSFHHTRLARPVLSLFRMCV